MLFEKYQDCFLVLGYPKIRINGFIYAEPPCCLLSAQEDKWFYRRNCLKNTKMAALCMAIFDI